MSYLRGDNYIWNDERFHFWIGDGFEDLKNMEWGEGKPSPGAVSIEEKVLNEFVVMRFSELLFSEKSHLQRALDNILKTNDNFGAQRARQFKNELTRIIDEYGQDI